MRWQPATAMRRGFQVIFKHLLSNDGGIVFHCTAGKDRTGMSAYLTSYVRWVLMKK